MSPASAEQITIQIRSVLERAWEYVAIAYQGRAYLALGYQTWDEYVDDRLGDHENGVVGDGVVGGQPPAHFDGLMQRGRALVRVARLGISDRRVVQAIPSGGSYVAGLVDARRRYS